MALIDYYEKLAMFNDCVASDSFKKFSDGYHTFEELYHHRVILSSVVFNTFKDISWKSKKHYDDEKDPMYDDMFIVGIDTPEGQATYHYHLAYWDLFDIPELETAKEFDGHTPDMAIERIKSLNKLISENHTNT